MARYVFHSFDYQQDNWRVNQVRNIGTVEGDQKLLPNEWQKLQALGHDAVKRWIDNQLQGRTCTIVMIGARTASRPWVLYEIARSWNLGKGVLGIHIHKLLDSSAQPSAKGSNPFAYVPNLPAVPAYDPPGWDSRGVHAIIAANIDTWVDNAIALRKGYP